MTAVGLALASCPPPAAAGGQSDRPRPCATRPAPPSGSGTTPPPVLAGPGVWSFVSEPGLHPQRVTVTADKPGTARGEIFYGPYAIGTAVYGQTGALMSVNSGDPVWFHPLPSPDLQNSDFKVQTYRGPKSGKSRQVLTWWQGSIAIPPTYENLPPGAPEPGGCYYIYDDHYRLLNTVFAHHGFYPDEHEFLLTRKGTALFIATKPVPMDLTPYGGPKDGAILDSEIQEVNPETGKLLFSWDLLDHLDPAESEVPASDAATSGGIWDAYHLNSLDEGPDGRLLFSLRNFWAIFELDKKTGDTRWQLGGKKSDFTFGPNADFYWQHDARYGPDHKISMFDDGCCATPDGTPEQESHGLVLDLDFTSHHATAARTYYHEPPLFSPSQGNTQPLYNGDKFIGWGQNSYYSEYANPGNTQGDGTENLLYDAQTPGSNISYRAFRNKWVGTPYYPPSAAARAEAGHTVVYASWNGSTETRAWRVLAGPNPKRLSTVVRRAARTGFETAVPTAARGPYFQVQALDEKGHVLKSSGIVTRPR